MPFQLDKKKLMIGGGLLLLLIIVIIAVVAMKKKSPQQHAADAQDAANMAVMHGKIAQAAASSPDNSAKDSVVKAAIAGSNQAAAQAVDSGSKAAAGTAPGTAPVTAPVNPSGPFYVYSNMFNKYIVGNTTQSNITWDTNKSNATPFTLGNDGTLSYNGYYLANEAGWGAQSLPQSKFGGVVGALTSTSTSDLVRVYNINSNTLLVPTSFQTKNVYLAYDTNSSGTGQDLTNSQVLYNDKEPMFGKPSLDSTKSFPVLANENIITLIHA